MVMENLLFVQSIEGWDIIHVYCFSLIVDNGGDVGDGDNEVDAGIGDDEDEDGGGIGDSKDEDGGENGEVDDEDGGGISGVDDEDMLRLRSRELGSSCGWRGREVVVAQLAINRSHS